MMKGRFKLMHMLLRNLEWLVIQKCLLVEDRRTTVQNMGRNRALFMKRGRPPTDFAARCPVRQNIASRRALGPLGFFQTCWLLESVSFHCLRYHGTMNKRVIWYLQLTWFLGPWNNNVFIQLFLWWMDESTPKLPLQSWDKNLKTDATQCKFTVLYCYFI